MSPIVPSRYGHPKYNVAPQKTRSTSQGGVKSSLRTAPNSDSKYSRRKQRLEESKITVQSAEDDDVDNFFSKHLAAIRFNRNHRLINVILNDTVVDTETTSDNDRLLACKKRVKTLTEFQKKVDDEIAEINEKFLTRKNKIIEDGRSFLAELNRNIEEHKRSLEEAKANKIKYDQEQMLIQTAAAAAAPVAPKNNVTGDSASQGIKNPTPSEDIISAKRPKLDDNETSTVVPMEVSSCENTNQRSFNNTPVKMLLDHIVSSISDTI